ncbi:protein of unknown function [Desulfovibrio sp. 86]|nr:protein of unknown function [Desulfovibrio sp. 86]
MLLRQKDIIFFQGFCIVPGFIQIYSMIADAFFLMYIRASSFKPIAHAWRGQPWQPTKEP